MSPPSRHAPGRIAAALLVGAALAVASGSCNWNSTISDLLFSCDASAECGDRFVCSNGQCEFVGDSGCVTGTPEVCNDNLDNNCDGLTDCADPVCDTLVCGGGNGKMCSAQVCTCSGNGSPPEAPERSCSDGIDNDCDSLVDCADPDCDTHVCDVANRTCIANACVGYARSTSPQPFVDACVQAGHISVLDGGDDSMSAVLPMPIPFRFFGEDAGIYWVTDNGTMSFSPTRVSASPYFFFGCLPAGSASARPAIYAFRDDLRTGPDGICIATTGAAPNRKMIVTWRNATHFQSMPIGPSQLTFSIFLQETSNNIDLVYQGMTIPAGPSAQGGSALVGVQGMDAGLHQTPYTEYSCQTPWVDAGTAIRFTP